MTQRAALLSVTDRKDIVDIGKDLAARGYALLATSGTARVLKEAGLAVREVGELSGVGELLGGRVKTLTPQVSGGILARRSLASDMQDIAKIGAPLIDIVVCNLYRLNLTEKIDVESIDIGGVTLIRAAAKNFADVAIAVDPADYARLGDAAEPEGNPAAGREERLAARKRLAAKAWQHVAEYDTAIAAAFAPDQAGSPLERERLNLPLVKFRAQRYGENPHQQSVWWTAAARGLHEAEILQGMELSYNNILDLLAAYQLALDMGPGAAAVIKHQNPCGAARLGTLADSVAAAIATDRLSAYGGIIAVDGAFDEAAVKVLGDLFVEVIVARSFSAGARAALAKRKKLRLVAWADPVIEPYEFKSIPGGVLMQTRDNVRIAPEYKTVTKKQPTPAQVADLELAEIIVKHARSNTIILVKGGVAVGIGAGQVSRVDAARDAARRAGENARGAVMASDAFFPFIDGIEAVPGVAAVLQPGGSIRDQEVIAAADRLGIAMVMTGVRHFKH